MEGLSLKRIKFWIENMEVIKEDRLLNFFQISRKIENKNKEGKICKDDKRD